MRRSRPVAILGAGHSGFGLAGDFGLRGVPVHLYEHPDFAAAVEPVVDAGGIAVRGVTGSGTARLARVTSDAAEALEGVDVVFVVVPAYAHAAMAAAASPHLRPEQLVVLMPGNAGGALAFRRALRAAGGAEATVCEAASFVFACKKDGPAGVWIRGVKKGLRVGVLPARETPRAMERIAPLLPMLEPARDVLETSLGNANHVAHPPAFLLNVARVEATGPDYSFFHEGMTRSVARLTEAVDRERMALVETLGYEAESTLEQLVRLYGDQGFGGADYYEAVHTTPVHGAARAPGSIDHRYFTEDVPFGLVPLASLGESLGVPMPVARGLIDVIGGLASTDFWNTGWTIRSLGLEGLDAPSVRRYAETGSR